MFALGPSRAPSPSRANHYTFNYVNTWPRVAAASAPADLDPSQGSGEDAIAWAADPSRKYPFIITFSPLNLVLRYHASYREQGDRYGYEVSGDQLGRAAPVYVAETDEIARRESEEHVEKLFNEFLHIPPELLFPPGYTSISFAQGDHESRQRDGV